MADKEEQAGPNARPDAPTQELGARQRDFGAQARIALAAAWRQAHAWFARAGAAMASRPAKPRSSPGLSGPRTSGWPPASQPLRRPRPRVWGSLAVAGCIALVLPIGFALYCLASLPVEGGLQVDPAQHAIVMQAGDGETFATRGVFRGAKLTADDLPRYLGPAIVAIEDRRFYQHSGIDPRGTFRALWRDLRAGGASREGGSTITQQLVRNTYLSADKTLRRKVQEALLSLWLERQLSKDEILLRYLNTAYFGAGSFGADAAAHRYFGKKAKDLTLAECAMLAGLVRAPSQLAPTRNFGGAKERADTVIQAMVDTGAITPQEADKARAEQVNLATPPETPPGANYFADMVSAEVKRLPNGNAGDLTLGTTLNLELQRLAEGVVERRLAAEGARKDASQGAMVVMGTDGAILAMVGGRDYEASQFNRTIQAKRQPGSLFKLFVYLTAFAKGYTPDSVMTDQPVRIGDWEPQNASSRFKGRMDLRSAFADSVNTVAAQLGAAVGIPAVIETARRLGVQSDLPARAEPGARDRGGHPAGNDARLCGCRGRSPVARRIRGAHDPRRQPAGALHAPSRHLRTRARHRPAAGHDAGSAAGRGDGGHRQGGPASAVDDRRQNRHHPGLSGCLVHRLHA